MGLLYLLHLSHYTLGILMMDYKWTGNMYRRGNEMKGDQIVHRVGVLYEWLYLCFFDDICFVPEIFAPVFHLASFLFLVTIEAFCSTLLIYDN
jgi:hypothetical protein